MTGEATLAFDISICKRLDASHLERIAARLSRSFETLHLHSHLTASIS